MTGKGEIAVGDKSYLKVILKESKTVIAFAANTTSVFNFSTPSETQEVNLIKGIARWVTGEKKGKGIKTPLASMGVRGTDFYVSHFPDLGETELMIFSGAVVIKNTATVEEEKVLTKDQWTGVGGRYGKTMAKVVDLTPEQIAKFDTAIPK